MGDMTSGPHGTNEVSLDVHMEEGGEHTGRHTLSPFRMEQEAPIRCAHNDK